MKCQNIYNVFSDFLRAYEKNFNELKAYINENNKRPSRNDRNVNIKELSYWLDHQLNNYKNKKK